MEKKASCIQHEPTLLNTANIRHSKLYSNEPNHSVHVLLTKHQLYSLEKGVNIYMRAK